MAAAVPQDFALPQILQNVDRGVGPETDHVADRGRPHIMAPIILALSLVVVGVLMSASIADLAGLSGLGGQDKPRPRLTALAVQPLALTSSFDATATSGPMVLESVPTLQPEELSLLEFCEAMIVAGNMKEAREALARASEGGSQIASFALAETFDPNMLAAWGLRDRVADVGAARALYAQALGAGDSRAQARLEALNAAH